MNWWAKLDEMHEAAKRAARTYDHIVPDTVQRDREMYFHHISQVRAALEPFARKEGLLP